MRSSVSCWLALSALLAGGCGGVTKYGDEVPHPTAVEPSTGQANQAVAVVIQGTNFFVNVVQPASGAVPWVDTTQRAWLDDVALGDVTWVSTTTLKATVPATLPPGAHRLTVENTLGERGSLDAAYTVLAPGSGSSGSGP